MNDRVRGSGVVQYDIGDGRVPRLTSHLLRMRLGISIILIDVISIGCAFAFSALFKHVGTSWYAIPIVLIAIYIPTALNTGAYGITALRDGKSGAGAALRSLLFTFSSLFLISYFFRTEQQLPRFLLLATLTLSAILVIIGRCILTLLIDRFWRPTLITELLLEVEPSDFVVPSNIRRISAADAGLIPDLRDPAMMNRFASMVRGVDRIIIASPPEQRKNWAMMLKGANVLGELLVDDLSDIGAFGLGHLGSFNTLTVSSGPLSLVQGTMKRTLDLLFCIPILLVLAPVLILTAIAIKLDSFGPVFFRQRRVGRGNAFFEILKFRSMHIDQCDANGNISTMRNDKRVTRVGQLIRRTSIDELPQLLNVLGGSMSLVGPRPHALGSVAGEHLFWDIDERYWHRHALKPGITGLAQVRGFRGATQLREDLSNRLQADLEYAANWSSWRDIAILFRTFRVIIHKNTY